MTDDNLCCTPPFVRAKLETLFNVLIVDYYDGPVEGVMQCLDCDAAYMYVMVACDSRLYTRIVALAPLELQWFCQLEELLATAQTNATEETREENYTKIRGILKQALPAQYLFAWQKPDDIITASRQVSEYEQALIEHGASWDSVDEGYEWFSALGLVK